MTTWGGVLLIGMFLMTIGETIAFPFSNTYALERAKRGRQGQYMALYSIAFGMTQMLSRNLGMQLIDFYGYETLWYLAALLMLVCIIILQYLKVFGKANELKIIFRQLEELA